MTEHSIFCRRLLGEAGWLGNAIIRTDAAGVIREIAPGAPDEADVRLNGAVIPGMPNCHSHAFQRQMAGLAGFAGPDGADSFWSWRDAMYSLANRLSPEQLQAIATWLYVEMLEAGYTSCAEFHYLHHQPDGTPYPAIGELGNRLLNAASRVGLSLTLLPVLYCRSGFGADGASDHQRRFINPPTQFLELFEHCAEQARSHPLHRVGLALHSLRAASTGQIAEVLDGEAGRAAAIHIHVAEQVGEVEQCLAAHGSRPVEWLLDNHPVDDRWCLIHATHMQPAEYDRAVASGATAGICPTTEADLGDGFFEAGYWMAKGGSLAVGSDSNLRISPCEELRLLEFGLRLRTGRRNVLTGSADRVGSNLYQQAASGGGAALGQPTGQLRPGFRADLVELDTEHPMLCGVGQDDLLDRYVFGGGAGMIRSVFVAGNQTVHEGKHQARDAAAAGFRAVMEELAG